MNLSEIINQIDDITDPSSMDTILMYLDYLKIKDEEFIELLMSKLHDMEITWEQPWYQKGMSLTRAMARNIETEELFRTDKICKVESIKIRKNWRKFRKLFNVPNNLESFAHWKNRNKSRHPNTAEECVRRFVTAFLAQGLERTLHQVYKFVVTHYGSPIKGPYSLQEEKLMEVCLYHNPNKTVPILSRVLGREPRGIYKKLREQSIGQIEKKRLKWKLPLASKFLNLLIKYTGLPIHELKYKTFDKSVWLKLEKDMDQQYCYLQKFWRDILHVQLFVKKDVKINKVRKRIARKLRKSSYLVWSDIRWKELLKEFPDGFTHTFLYKVWYTIFKNHKERLKVSLEELIEYALQQIPLLQNRRLKTLEFIDSELIEVKYNIQ